jgi:hypothetical protein
MDRDDLAIVQRYRLARLVCIYIIALFIVIRVWVYAVETKDTAIISITAVLNAVLLLCWLRYHRMRIAREIQQREQNNEIYAIVVNNQLEALGDRRRMLLAHLQRHPGESNRLTDEDIALLPVCKYDPPSSELENLSSSSENLMQKGSSNDNAESPVCSVCLSEYMKDDLLMTLPCHHQYHQVCVTEWLHIRNFCPMCKQQVQVVRPISVGDIEMGLVSEENATGQTNNDDEAGARFSSAENVARTDAV